MFFFPFVSGSPIHKSSERTGYKEVHFRCLTICEVMKKEIDYAVEHFHRIAFGTKKHGNKYISESKLASFITIMTDILFKRYEGHWHPGNPERGSGFRCIRLNGQQPDPLISECMRLADIALPKDFMTQELTIWVDPGVVSVRIGEDGSIGSEILDEEVYRNGLKAVIFDAPEPIKRSGSVDDDDYSSRSSTPDSKAASDRSNSPLTMPSPTPNFVSTSPVPADKYYDPFNPPRNPHQVSFPQTRWSQARQANSPPSPPSPASRSSYSSSPSPVKNTSPTRAFHSMAAARRSPLNSRGSPISFNSQRDFSQSGHNIPGFSQRSLEYSRPRAIFPASSESSSQFEGHNRYHHNQYSMPMNFERPTANFYDIPAMA